MQFWIKFDAQHARTLAENARKAHANKTRFVEYTDACFNAIQEAAELGRNYCTFDADKLHEELKMEMMDAGFTFSGKIGGTEIRIDW